MPSIHPSEDPPLGWLVPCLNCADLAATAAFYQALDFAAVGGNADQGWLCLRNRASELHLFQGHITADLLNFRGGDVAAIAEALTARGLTATRQTFAQDDGCVGAIFTDPDGRELFFDTHPDEAVRYAAGEPLTCAVEGDPRDGDGRLLGNLTWCLRCADFAATRAFYETVGFAHVGGEPAQGWAIHARVDHPPAHGTAQVATYLSCFAGMIPSDTLNFRGGDVTAIAAQLMAAGVDLGPGVQTGEDGGESLMLADPDGRAVFFDTTPPERLY